MAKLVGEIGVPLIGRRVSVLVSSSASGSFLGKVRSRVKGGSVYSVKDVTMEMFGKKEVCVVLTPSSGVDYRVAKELAEAGFTTVIVNGLFKVSAKRLCIFNSISLLQLIIVFLVNHNLIINAGSKKYTTLRQNGLLPKALNVQLTSCRIPNSPISKSLDSD